MSEISLRPLGFNVLIEMLTVEAISAGGIIMGNTEREQSACEFGVVKDFGNCCYAGVAGCDPEKYPPGDARSRMTPNQLWGVEIGDTVEIVRHQGSYSAVKELGNLRYVPDTQVRGVVTGKKNLTKADF